MTAGRSPTIFLVDGGSSKMLTAGAFGWTGHVLRVPRLQPTQALRREEVERTGVHIPRGTSEGDAMTGIGEVERTGDRVRRPDAERADRDEALVVTAPGDALHIVHAKHLAAERIEWARVAGAGLGHAVAPERSSRDEASPSDLPAFVLAVPAHGIEGQAVLRDGEFVVKAGSRARRDWASRAKGDRRSRSGLHAKLVGEGPPVPDERGAAFVPDDSCGRASAAGSVKTGRSRDGRRAWQHRGIGETFGEWETGTVEGEQATI